MITTKINFSVKNLEIQNDFQIGTFNFYKVEKYDEVIKKMNNEKKDYITFNAISEIQGEDTDELKKKITLKENEIDQINWILSFAQGIRISRTGHNISPKVPGLHTGNFFGTKSAKFPKERIMDEENILKLLKQIEKKITEPDFLRINNLLFPIAFYLAGIEDNMLTNCFIFPYISLESLVLYNTEEFIYGNDGLPNGLTSEIKNVLTNHSSFDKLSEDRKKELFKKISELKRRPISDRIIEFMENNNIGLKDYDYDIKMILNVRNKIFHKAEKIESESLVKCMKNLRSLVVRSILSKLAYNGDYLEITKGWKKIKFIND
jgi:hypothetical protein